MRDSTSGETSDYPRGIAVQRLASGEIVSVRVDYGPSLPKGDMDLAAYEERQYRPPASTLPDLSR